MPLNLMKSLLPSQTSTKLKTAAFWGVPSCSLIEA